MVLGTGNKVCQSERIPLWGNTMPEHLQSAARGLERQRVPRQVSKFQPAASVLALTALQVSVWQLLKTSRTGYSLYALLKFYHTSHLNYSRIKFHVFGLYLVFLQKIAVPFCVPYFQAVIASCNQDIPQSSPWYARPVEQAKFFSCHKAFSPLLLYICVYFTSLHALFLNLFK